MKNRNKNNDTISVGSVCSGIGAAPIAWKDQRFHFEWFSEIADFPSRILKLKYPNVFNLGDMCNIPDLLVSNEIIAPDIICGGTPCQAFSFAGWKKGLNDERGNLTLKFVDILNCNDKRRAKEGKNKTIIFWENVEGVLRDSTNAFGCFLSSLIGLDDELIILSRWPSSGVIHGPKRNVAWRVIDAKYFGLPHQRKRLYVLAGGKDFYPENIIFDNPSRNIPSYNTLLKFKKANQDIEIFRSYTDCLYSSYGTKWNGNAAAYNGSLFIVQNKRLRRLTPLECERLMGFPDGYTDIEKAKPTNRYQAIGNSWAVPVIKWFGQRIDKFLHRKKKKSIFSTIHPKIRDLPHNQTSVTSYSTLGKYANKLSINGTDIIENAVLGSMKNIIDIDPHDNFFISPVGCKGILRRKEERDKKINTRLEYYLTLISSQMCEKEIERVSRVQKRGKFSTTYNQII